MTLFTRIPRTRRILLFCLCIILLTVTAASAEMVSIDGKNVNLRSGPGTRYKVLWELGSGFPLKVVSRKGKWLRVKDFEGTVGWVHRTVVGKSPHVVVTANKNTKKSINVRSGPGTNYNVVAKAYYGVVFETVKKENGWVQVRHEDGVNGWIKQNLLWGW